jgi:hypothetical protein
MQEHFEPYTGIQEWGNRLFILIQLRLCRHRKHEII